MVRLFYSKPAIDDLKSIYDFIAFDSKVAAKRFVGLLKERIKILKDHPEIGKEIYTNKFKNLRQLLYKSYRIIYQLKITRSQL